LGFTHAPRLWWVFAGDRDDTDVEGIKVRLVLGDEIVLDPSPSALQCRHAPADAVGLAYAVSSTATFTPRVGAGSVAVAAPRRLQTRFVTVLLRDGTSAGFSMFPGDSRLQGVSTASGRAAAHLRRVLGLPSGVVAPEPRSVAARCWLWALVSRLGEVSSPAVASELFAAAASAPVSPAAFGGVPPVWGRVAAAAAGGAGWPEILEGLRRSTAVAGADPAAAEGSAGAARSRQLLELWSWLDADLLGVEAATQVPDVDALAELWEALGEVAPVSFSGALVAALDAVGS
jgi:hypothetical protein